MSDSARELLREAQSMLRHDLGCPYPTMVQRRMPNAAAWCQCEALGLSDRITALLAAEPDATPAGDGWMPMVSAPLDGTPVELLIRHHDYWTALKLDGKERADREYQMICNGQWIDHNRGGWCWAGLAGTQVGWRLPAPPTDNAKGK